MPIELCKAVTTFQRLLQTTLIGLFLKHHVICVDDILIFGRDMEDHVIVNPVLERLWDAGLTLNPKKCRFLKRLFTILGHGNGGSRKLYKTSENLANNNQFDGAS